jgi:hypothetical protein
MSRDIFRLTMNQNQGNSTPYNLYLLQAVRVLQPNTEVRPSDRRG